jgi:hypothetical protein
MKRLPWSLQTRNKPGFSPRRMPSPPPKKIVTRVDSDVSFDVSVEHQLSSELERKTDSTRKDFGRRALDRVLLRRKRSCRQKSVAEHRPQLDRYAEALSALGR